MHLRQSQNSPMVEASGSEPGGIGFDSRLGQNMSGLSAQHIWSLEIAMPGSLALNSACAYAVCSPQGAILHIV